MLWVGMGGATRGKERGNDDMREPREEGRRPNVQAYLGGLGPCPCVIAYGVR